MRDEEGYLPIGPYRLWYRSVGGDQESVPPLLILHGGPGVPHDYLQNLAALASPQRRVIFYDQLGCGRSDCPDDLSLWRVDRFVEEVGHVRAGLGLDRVHLLGQSWGGLLAQSYLLTQPGGVSSLILANSLSSLPLWVAEANRLRADLPPEIQETLLRHEAAGTTDSAEYQEALLPFYRRHVIRVEPWPDFVRRSFETISVAVYGTMNGPSEFHVIGNLRDYDITDRLGEIAVPTLIISGRYDESTPAINEVMHRGIRNSEWVLLEDSSHLAHVEEPEKYLRIVSAWLERIDATSVSRAN
jgi:proline-specific peptidase